MIKKKRYLDKHVARNNDTISGPVWYNAVAARAVSQSIGRIIRHKNDFGAIIFLDHRFSGEIFPHSFKNNLPNWLGQFKNMVNN